MSGCRFSWAIVALVLCQLGLDRAGARIVGELDTNDVPDFCDSQVYCQGELLKRVQLANLTRDSKAFVDLYQKQDEEVTLANFKMLMQKTNDNPSREELRKFVNDHFEDVNELQNATLADWREHVSLMKRVRDPNYKRWVYDLNQIWKMLARKMTDDVRNRPRRHSLIYVDHPFIIPGGRFKEFYYWDSYWVIEGLLLSDMYQTSRGMIENFKEMIERYGFIPNGGRVYYLMRSQPPLLTSMIEKYYEFTKDWKYVVESLPILEKEFKYWKQYKTLKIPVNGKIHEMYRYVTSSEGPRPESYREDYHLAQGITDPEKKRRFYNNVKAGAESGWDFSARWFVGPKGEFSFDLDNINTQDVVPVDLNAFVERNARTLAIWFNGLKNYKKAKYYKGIAEDLRAAIAAVNWNSTEGTWFDYDAKHQKHRTSFYPSNLAPLYTMSYERDLASSLGQQIVDYLHRKGILDFAGGVPTSLDNSSQQWDFPNAWPPLQSIVVQGLQRTGYQPAMKVARTLAYTWLRSNYIGFNDTDKMYEKYDATSPGRYGGGGEYDVQNGFGWTNGVVLEFLATYPDLTFNSNAEKRPHYERFAYQNHLRTAGSNRPVLRSIWNHYCQKK
ncbi:trehalase-like [Copidosoma floridanum]|uniref:trehalase-like n=1 Tax=Copidosoma floridanum TaxID=29053 RepID=UPI0006C94A87|nr:trehalase-like [Copidosoma floridanum]